MKYGGHNPNLDYSKSPETPRKEMRINDQASPDTPKIQNGSKKTVTTMKVNMP